MADDNSAQFNIEISTAADTSGAQETVDSLRQVEAEANAANDAASSSGGVSTKGAEEAKQALAEIREAKKEVTETPAEVRVKVSGENEAKSAFSGLKSAAADFFKTIEEGTGIAIGEKLVEGLSEIASKFVEVTKEGIEFDKEMETLGIGLAASLRQADPQKYMNWEAAKAAGASAMDALKEKANELGLNVHALGESLQVNLLALTEGGIKDINQQIETTSLLMQAAAAKGVSGMQAMRDIMDTLQGRADRVVLSKELGISNEDIANAKEAGTLFEYLTDKLGAYKDAAKDAAESLAGLEQRGQNLFQQIAGEGAQPVVDALKEILSATQEWISRNPEIAEEFRTIASAAVNFVKPLGAAVQMAADLAESVAYAASWWLKITGLATEAADTAKSHVAAVNQVKESDLRRTSFSRHHLSGAKSIPD